MAGGRGAGQRAPPPCPSSYCGSRGELACPCVHLFSEGSPDTRVQLCLGAFSPQVREDAREARTHVYGCPACVRAFGPCVPEDASQVRHDTCAYRPCPHVSAGAWVRPPCPREHGEEGEGRGHSPGTKGAAQLRARFSSYLLTQSHSKTN